MEEGRRGARERRRVLGELKMRCHVVQGENASPWDEALAGIKQLVVSFFPSLECSWCRNDRTSFSVHSVPRAHNSDLCLLSCLLCPWVHALHSSQEGCSSKAHSHLLLCVLSVRRHSCFARLNQS